MLPIKVQKYWKFDEIFPIASLTGNKPGNRPRIRNRPHNTFKPNRSKQNTSMKEWVKKYFQVHKNLEVRKYLKTNLTGDKPDNRDIIKQTSQKNRTGKVRKIEVWKKQVIRTIAKIVFKFEKIWKFENSWKKIWRAMNQATDPKSKQTSQKFFEREKRWKNKEK